MKTSHSQFLQLVDFMERKGDLSKPTGGARGRQWCIKKWKELAVLLNCDGTGDSRSEDKWRKVWSDLKNNTKKKAAKVRRSINGTGGGPAYKAILTDLEERILQIIGEQAATGMPTVREAGLLVQESIEAAAPASVAVASSPLTLTCEPNGDESWNFPSGSQMPTPLLHVEVVDDDSPENAREEQSLPQSRRKPKNIDLDFRNRFLENERERDRRYYEIEKERLRQRDIELKLQAQWLDLIKEALSVVASFMEGKKRDE